MHRKATSAAAHSCRSSARQNEGARVTCGVQQLLYALLHRDANFSPSGELTMHISMSASALLSRPLILSLNQQWLQFSRWSCSAKHVSLSHTVADKSASETILLCTKFSFASNFFTVPFELTLFALMPAMILSTTHVIAVSYEKQLQPFLLLASFSLLKQLSLTGLN